MPPNSGGSAGSQPFRPNAALGSHEASVPSSVGALIAEWQRSSTDISDIGDILFDLFFMLYCLCDFFFSTFLFV